MKIIKSILGIVGLAVTQIVFLSAPVLAQDPPEEAVPVVKLHYFNLNNDQQYLILDSKLKKGTVYTPQANKSYQIYVDSSVPANLAGTIKTDLLGKGKLFLPPSLKGIWDAKSKHVFILKAGDEDVITDYSITKAKVSLDTSNADGVRSITAKVMKLDGANWVPAKDVEMKLGIERLGSILPAGDEATLTTDSSGSVTAEFKKVGIPGDEKGNLVLAAKVDDNEELGNLLCELPVVWGKPSPINNNFFNQRTLWTTRFKTPYWLLFLAYSIVISVWGTLIYLIRQIIKIKKIGV